MSRELHKKKGKELYALYSTVTESYLTHWESKENIRKIWLNDYIKEAEKEVDKHMEKPDKEVE